MRELIERRKQAEKEGCSQTGKRTKLGATRRAKKKNEPDNSQQVDLLKVYPQSLTEGVQYAVVKVSPADVNGTSKCAEQVRVSFLLCKWRQTCMGWSLK